MKRILLCLSVFAHTSVPVAEAQTPEACDSGVNLEYIGTYGGDLSGDMRGSFFAGTSGCNNDAIGRGIIGFQGSLAQFFFSDPLTESAVTFTTCVKPDLSFRDDTLRNTDDGGQRGMNISGTMDLSACTLRGTWETKINHIPEGEGTFTMTYVPPSLMREPIRWVAVNGDFNIASNWDPEGVPGADQDAVFDQILVYAVSFGTPASSGGFDVKRGFVTFLTGTYQATGGSELVPSAVVGTAIDTNTFLSLSSHNLTTAFSIFAPDSGHRGGVVVKDGSNWTEQGRMVIGGGGAGSLEIQESAAVSSMETQIGSEASGEGEVTLTPQFPSKGLAAEWTTGSIAVGLRGKGTVEHRGGSIQSHVVSIAVEPGSLGTVTVGSAGNTAIWEFDGDMIVGQGGIGRLNIVEGGYVVSTAPGTNFVFVGLLAGSSIGNLRVEGASSTLDVPKAIVSAGGSSSGSGFISVKNGGLVKCRSTCIEQNGSLRVEDSKLTFNNAFLVGNLGTVALNNGSLVAVAADAELRVSTGGLVTGSGSIRVAEPEIFGNVAPGVVISDPKGLPGLDDAIGTLTFGGNVDFASATLEIDVGGLAEGNFDVIHATGAVDIQDSTVLFRFIDGFLPRTGDTVPFLVADGGVTIANLVLEFEGVAEGFQFEVREENGMLVFEALNDAEPAPIPSADLDGDGDIDFVDLLIFMLQLNSQK
jgi:T5SS/PEP-CTERM-associated repeat protein